MDPVRVWWGKAPWWKKALAVLAVPVIAILAVGYWLTGRREKAADVEGWEARDDIYEDWFDDEETKIIELEAARNRVKERTQNVEKQIDDCGDDINCVDRALIDAGFSVDCPRSADTCPCGGHQKR